MAIEDPEICRHSRVYQLANYFRLDDLKDTSLVKFEITLEKLCLTDTFAKCVCEVYSQDLPDDRRFRDAVADTAVYHIKELHAKGGFQDLISSQGEFARDLVVKLGKS